jgi:hypothetical protein
MFPNEESFTFKKKINTFMLWNEEGKKKLQVFPNFFASVYKMGEINAN